LNQLGGAGLGFSALLAGTAHAQVDVGKASGIRKLIPAETLEASAKQQYQQTLGEIGRASCRERVYASV
jgi:hypothetical protein